MRAAFFEGKVMRTLAVPVLAILIAVVVFTQPSEAQNQGISNAIVGQHLYNLWGNDLGKIECVKSDAYGRPAFMILSTPDNKAVSVPISELVSDRGLNYLVVNITMDQLHSLSSASRYDANEICPL